MIPDYELAAIIGMLVKRLGGNVTVTRHELTEIQMWTLNAEYSPGNTDVKLSVVG